MNERYEKGDVDPLILERRETCTGNIVYRVGVDEKGRANLDSESGRGRCILCRNKTHFYCLTCHTWLCGPREGDKNAGLRFIEISAGKRLYFRHSCWHTFHKDALRSNNESENSPLSNEESELKKRRLIFS